MVSFTEHAFTRGCGLLAVLGVVVSGIGSIGCLVSAFLYSMSEAVISNILDNSYIFNKAFAVFNLTLVY